MSKKKQRERVEPESLGLPRVGVETHAHLDLPELAADLSEVLARARCSGVARIGQVFLGPEAYRRNVSLFDGADDVFFLLGEHPNEADKLTRDGLAAMEEAFRADPRLKAFGEIGLDYYWERVPHDVQQRAFRDQLALSRALGVPAVIHCRDAFADTLAVLDDMGMRDAPVLWHCFGGDTAMLREIRSRGWWVSISGPVTYGKNEELRAAVAENGLDRLVLETDCPYLAPEPWRGKRNEPAYLVFTAAQVAAVLGLPTEEVWRATAKNAEELFGL